ncbi:MAG: Gfo/Idh/MocA family oxidoreductase [Planctomycetes bacterium]|nr:Gfo/Idh/MocA family oxidoreductase [Planctomycetota bacterium]
MADKVRYGVISTAKIGRTALIPGAQKTTNSEVVAISSRDKSKAEECAKELGIPKAYGSYDEVLHDPDVDAVIAPLPNALHCEWAVKAAEAGKHILCEKPLAVTVEEAQQMIDAAKANHVLLMEAFMYRFHPQHTFVKKKLASGAVGDIKIVRAEFSYFLGDWETNIRASGEMRGGGLMDVGCYAVNALRFLMGDEPVSVQAYHRFDETHGVDGTFVGILKFPGGRMGILCSGMEEFGRNRYEIIGTEGMIDVPRAFTGGSRGATVTVVSGKDSQTETFEDINQYQAEIEHFSGCILNGKEPMLTPEDAKKNTAVIVALKHAARKEKAVPVA